MPKTITITLTESDAQDLLTMWEYPKEIKVHFIPAVERFRREIKDRLLYEENSENTAMRYIAPEVTKAPGI